MFAWRTTLRHFSRSSQMVAASSAGVPGFEITNWFGVCVPAGTPKAVIAKLNTEMSTVLNLPDVKQRLADQGVETVGNSVEQFDVFFRAEILKYAKIIRQSGARPD
jgi:tripartite-type tricarboxylate transporter receptor subunit TctC